MKNKFVSTFIVAGLVTTCSIANAKDPKWYVGAGIGSSSIETGVSNLTGTASLDEDDTGFKLFAGYKITKNFSVEGFYGDFGESTLTGNNGDTFTLGGTAFAFTANNVSISAEGTAFGLAGIFNMPLSKAIGAHVKVGAMSWDIEADVSSSAGSANASADGTDLYYGVGATYNFNKNMGVAVEYELYDYDGADVELISANFVYSF